MKNRKEYDRLWRRKNKDKIKAAQQKYKRKHRKRILARRRYLYAVDPTRRAYNVAWNKAHPIKAKRSRVNWNLKNRGKLLYCFAKGRAKRKGIPFNIQHSDVVIPERCPVFGFKLSRVFKKGDLRSPSLDRIVPRKGYVKGNVAVISLRANLLKNNATLKELAALTKWLARMV